MYRQNKVIYLLVILQHAPYHSWNFFWNEKDLPTPCGAVGILKIQPDCCMSQIDRGRKQLKDLPRLNNQCMTFRRLRYHGLGCRNQSSIVLLHLVRWGTAISKCENTLDTEIQINEPGEYERHPSKKLLSPPQLVHLPRVVLRQHKEAPRSDPKYRSTTCARGRRCFQSCLPEDEG